MKRLKTWHLMALAIALPILFYGLPALGISLGSVLVFLLILACPLMHLLGLHGRHGHAGQGGTDSDRQKVPTPQTNLGGPDATSGR